MKRQARTFVETECSECHGKRGDLVGCADCCRDCGRPCSFDKDNEGFHRDTEDDGPPRGVLAEIQAMPVDVPSTPEEHVAAAMDLMAAARGHLKAANALRTLARLNLAISSGKGAARHASGTAHAATRKVRKVGAVKVVGARVRKRATRAEMDELVSGLKRRFKVRR